MSIDSRDPRATTDLPDEAALLEQARALLPPVDAEPRPGFAARVAARAQEARTHRVGASWLRWALPVGALASTAAALFFLSGPRANKPVEVARSDRADLVLRAPDNELAMAEKLELYENLTLLQNEEALEDLDVVAALREEPEAKP